jgi:hypothetical protein
MTTNGASAINLHRVIGTFIFPSQVLMLNSALPGVQRFAIPHI